MCNGGGIGKRTVSRNHCNGVSSGTREARPNTRFPKVPYVDCRFLCTDASRR